MFNLLKVIDCGPLAEEETAASLRGALEQAGATLPGVHSQIVGETLPRALNGGHVMWRTTFACETDYWACIASPQWRQAIEPLLAPERGVIVDTIGYRTGVFDNAPGRQREGLWRCLMFSVDAATPAASVRQFERDLLLMPGFVGAIRNWALSSAAFASGRRSWTHIWEQEFDDVAGLEGEYMIHPIHWGLVDGWFDAECPQRIVDPWLIHAAIPITAAVIR